MAKVVNRNAAVRLTPVVGQKVWFGPRGLGGWGWIPVSWQGWTILALALGAIGVAILRYGEDRATPAVLAITAVLLLLCRLKGTSPGSARAKAEFDRARRTGK